MRSEKHFSKSILKFTTPTRCDVLCGRGGAVNLHPGNITYRKWVAELKGEYHSAHEKSAKSAIAQKIVTRIHSLKPRGRFLRKVPSNKNDRVLWFEIDDNSATSKTCQALREGMPSVPGALKRKASYSLVTEPCAELDEQNVVLNAITAEKEKTNVLILKELEESSVTAAAVDAKITSCTVAPPSEDIVYNLFDTVVTETDLVSENSETNIDRHIHTYSVTPEQHLSDADNYEIDYGKIFSTATVMSMVSEKLFKMPKFLRENSLALSEISLEEYFDNTQEFRNLFENEEDTFTSIQELLSEDTEDIHDSLPFTWEQDSSCMFTCKLNVIDPMVIANYEEDDDIHLLPLDFENQVEDPIGINVIENDNAMDHDLSAWMKLGFDGEIF